MASQKFKVYDKGLELNLNVLSEARWLKGKIGEWLAEKYLRELFPDLHIYPLTSLPVIFNIHYFLFSQEGH